MRDTTGKPARPPRWRELTDEQQWERIYADRERRRKSAPKNLPQAVALTLPAYVLQNAISDCHATFQAVIRHDVHVSVVTTIARVAALLPREELRTQLADRLEHQYQGLRYKGFYLDNREFLYANACALVRMVDDFRYPPDAPCVPAALMLKEDAETDEEGDWSLSQSHAARMAGVAYDNLLDTGLFSYPGD